MFHTHFLYMQLCRFLLLSFFLLCSSTLAQQQNQTESNSTKILAGVTLRCCILEKPPYIFRTNKSSIANTYDGWTFAYYQELKNRLGFQCIQPLIPYNGTDDDFLKMFANCSNNDGTIRNDSSCPCDFPIATFTERPERMIVDFLPDHGFDRILVATRMENTENSTSLGIIFHAFEPTVWCAIVGLICLFTLLKLLDPRFSPIPPIKEDLSSKPYITRIKRYLLKNSILYRLRKSFQSSVSTLLGYPREVTGEDKSTRMWFLNITIVLCGLFLVLIYEASMVARLIQEDGASKYISRNNLANCDINDAEICMIRNSSAQVFWDDVISKHFTQCRTYHSPPLSSSSSSSSDNGPFLYNNSNDLFNAMLRKKRNRCEYMLGDEATIAEAVSKYCGRLIKVGSAAFTQSVGFVVAKNWKYEPHFRKAILQIMEDNSLISLQDYVLSKANEKNTKCTPVTLPTLSFRRLQAFFYIAFGACALMLILMLIDPQKPFTITQSPEGQVPVSINVQQEEEEQQQQEQQQQQQQQQQQRQQEQQQQQQQEMQQQLQQQQQQGQGQETEQNQHHQQISLAIGADAQPETAKN